MSIKLLKQIGIAYFMLNGSWSFADIVYSLEKLNEFRQNSINLHSKLRMENAPTDQKEKSSYEQLIQLLEETTSPLTRLGGGSPDGVWVPLPPNEIASVKEWVSEISKRHYFKKIKDHDDSRKFLSSALSFINSKQKATLNQKYSRRKLLEFSEELKKIESQVKKSKSFNPFSIGRNGSSSHFKKKLEKIRELLNDLIVNELPSREGQGALQLDGIDGTEQQVLNLETYFLQLVRQPFFKENILPEAQERFKSAFEETKFEAFDPEEISRSGFPRLSSQQKKIASVSERAQDAQRLALAQSLDIFGHPDPEAYRRALVMDLSQRPFVFKTVSELLKTKAFQPVIKEAIDGITFYLSQPWQIMSTDHTYVIMYAKGPDSVIYPRLVYKSRSDGGWRSAPAITFEPTPKLWKWNCTRELDSHYTQETKIVPKLASVLLDLEAKFGKRGVGEEVLNYFDYQRDENESFFTLGSELTYHMKDIDLLHPFQKYKPGINLRSKTQLERRIEKLDAGSLEVFQDGAEIDLAEYFKTVVDPSMMGEGKFIPDFSRKTPSQEYMMNHTLLSNGLDLDIQVRVYEGVLSNRIVEWHMANDKEGRVWIDRINFKDAKVNTYGVLDIVIDSGALTNKPLEYNTQIPEMSRRYVRPFGVGQYSDFSMLLDYLLPIEVYRKTWNIERK